MVTQSEDENLVLVKSIAEESDNRYRLTLMIAGMVQVFSVRAVEHAGGIRAIEESEDLFQALSRAGKLGTPKHIFHLIWSFRDGNKLSFPVEIREDQEAVTRDN